MLGTTRATIELASQNNKILHQYLGHKYIVSCGTRSSTATGIFRKLKHSKRFLTLLAMVYEGTDSFCAMQPSLPPSDPTKGFREIVFILMSLGEVCKMSSSYLGFMIALEDGIPRHEGLDDLADGCALAQAV